MQTKKVNQILNNTPCKQMVETITPWFKYAVYFLTDFCFSVGFIDAHCWNIKSLSHLWQWFLTKYSYLCIYMLNCNTVVFFSYFMSLNNAVLSIQYTKNSSLMEHVKNTCSLCDLQSKECKVVAFQCSAVANEQIQAYTLAFSTKLLNTSNTT